MSEVLPRGTLVFVWPARRHAGISDHSGMGIVFEQVAEADGVYNIVVPRRVNMMQQGLSDQGPEQSQRAGQQFDLAHAQQNGAWFFGARRGLDFDEVRRGVELTVDLSNLQIVANSFDSVAATALQERGRALGAGRRAAVVRYTVPERLDVARNVQYFQITVDLAHDHDSDVLGADQAGVDPGLPRRVTLLPPCFQDPLWSGPARLLWHDRVRVYRTTPRRIDGHEESQRHLADDSGEPIPGNPRVRDAPWEHPVSEYLIAVDQGPMAGEAELPVRDGDLGTVVLVLARQAWAPRNSAYWVEFDDGSVEPVQANEAAFVEHGPAPSARPPAALGFEESASNEGSGWGTPRALGDAEAADAGAQHAAADAPAASWWRRVRDEGARLMRRLAPAAGGAAEEAGDEGGHYASMLERSCALCLQDKRLVVLLPCRHRCVCEDCWATMQRRHATQCPQCRAAVTNTVVPFNAVFNNTILTPARFAVAGRVGTARGSDWTNKQLLRQQQEPQLIHDRTFTMMSKPIQCTEVEYMPDPADGTSKNTTRLIPRTTRLKADLYLNTLTTRRESFLKYVRSYFRLGHSSFSDPEITQLAELTDEQIKQIASDQTTFLHWARDCEPLENITLDGWNDWSHEYTAICDEMSPIVNLNFLEFSFLKFGRRNIEIFENFIDDIKNYLQKRKYNEFWLHFQFSDYEMGNDDINQLFARCCGACMDGGEWKHMEMELDGTKLQYCDGNIYAWLKVSTM